MFLPSASFQLPIYCTGDLRYVFWIGSPVGLSYLHDPDLKVHMRSKNTMREDVGFVMQLQLSFQC